MGKVKKKKKDTKRKRPTSAEPCGSDLKGSFKTNPGKESNDDDVAYLLTQVEENIDSFNYEAAEQLGAQVLALQPDNVCALEQMASVLIELGKFEDAKKQLLKAISLAPESGHRKYMTTAQMCSGKEALQHYEKGIGILNNDLITFAGQNAQNNQGMVDLKRDLSTAHCAIAELYMTDCCYDENAEVNCFENLEKSVAVDESNIEAHQTFASFYLVKEDKQKALESMQKSLSLWLPNFQATREGRSNPGDLIEVCPVSYPSRTNAVKLLIELEDYDNAETILEGLVEEDDEVIETWYLLGWMNFLKGKEFKNNAQFYLLKCQEVAEKIHSDEEDILNHIKELLQTIKSADGDDICNNDASDGKDNALEQ